ncbi:hypothetical protein SHO565_53460 [Streptomyces sp. HO565]
MTVPSVVSPDACGRGRTLRCRRRPRAAEPTAPARPGQRRPPGSDDNAPPAAQEQGDPNRGQEFSFALVTPVGGVAAEASSVRTLTEFEGSAEEAMTEFAKRVNTYDLDVTKVKRREVFRCSDRSYFVRVKRAPLSVRVLLPACRAGGRHEVLWSS